MGYLNLSFDTVKTKIERQKKLDREIEQLARGGKNFVTSIPLKFNCDSESRAVFVDCAQAIARYKNKLPWVEVILRRKPKKAALIPLQINMLNKSGR